MAVHDKPHMRATATFLVAFASALVFTGCATTPKPTAADNAFEEFRKGMMARLPSVTSTQAQRSVAKDSLSQTNQGTIALPPPFLQLPEQKAAREEVEKSGVSPALVQKMLQGHILTLAEIQELAQKKVSDTNIVKYLRSTGAVYTLTTKQIDELRAASVSNEVLDYLLSTPALRRSLYYPTLYPSYLYRHYYPSWGYHHYDYDLHHYDLHRYDVHHNSGHH